MTLKSLKKYSFTDWLLPIALISVGGFHEYISCGLSIVMCIWLLLRLGKDSLQFRQESLTIGVAAVCLGYALTCLWGIDRGMSFVGFLKFLPVLLYVLCIQQKENARSGLELLPWVGAITAVISAVGMQFPAGERYFAVAGRLGGFFQYPNTFAAFLLVCELLVLKKTGKKLYDYVLLVILIGAFLYTGSRTALLVGLLANFGMLLALTQKKTRILSLAVFGAVVLVGVVFALVPNSVMNRYLQISFTESTFVGRLLYWQDALKLLVRYPFGMGYLGYYYAQHSVQTGVYSVMYLHNDWLQLLLDIGWVPAGIFIGTVIAWFVRKGHTPADKIIVGALCLHSFFDFNLQYVSMFFLLILLMWPETAGKQVKIKAKTPWKVTFAIVAIVSLYIGSALMLAHSGERKLSDSLYPGNTQNKLAILQRTKDLETANTLAEEILEQNTQFYAPYSVRAKYCYATGDFGSLLKYGRAALERNPFDHREYESYCKMLANGVEAYQKAGDMTSAEICRKELLSVSRQLATNRNRLSTLGKKISDQPVTALSPELQEKIDRLTGN